MANHERATGLTQHLTTYLEQRTMQESEALAEAEAQQQQEEEDAQRAHEHATHNNNNNNRWAALRQTSSVGGRDASQWGNELCNVESAVAFCLSDLQHGVCQKN